MKRKRKIYSVLNLVSAFLMILALLWLTVSAPYVYESQQELAKLENTDKNISPLSGTDEESNPFGNSTEEKSPNSTSFSEEYLHDHHKHDHFLSEASQFYKLEDAGTYIAYHGELDVPPPDQA
jgi:hypothetical protein